MAYHCRARPSRSRAVRPGMRYPEQGDRISIVKPLAPESQGAGLLGSPQSPASTGGVLKHPPPTPRTPGSGRFPGVEERRESSWAVADELATIETITQTARDWRSMDRSF